MSSDKDLIAEFLAKRGGPTVIPAAPANGIETLIARVLEIKSLKGKDDKVFDNIATVLCADGREIGIAGQAVSIAVLEIGATYRFSVRFNQVHDVDSIQGVGALKRLNKPPVKVEDAARGMAP